VGQARWVERAAGFALLDASTLKTKAAFEARAWQEFYAGAWARSLSETESWLADEPYSSRPATLGSYVAGSVLEQYDRAVLIARLGLRANPGEKTLLNNLAFSLINCGELDEAEQTLQWLQTPPLDSEHEILLKATSGLLKFRRGDLTGGRQLYTEAIQLSDSKNFDLLRARATVFLAFEEARAKSPLAREAYLKAVEYAKSIDHPDFKLQLSRI
jgi:hypothetical protein